MKADESAILTYHSIDDSGSVLSTRPAAFAEQLAWLSARGSKVVSLEAVRHTPGAVALTFDDGYLNFHEVALPLLEKHRFPSTVFVTTAFLGGRNDWEGRAASLPRLRMMAVGDIRDAANRGVTIGAHTLTHPKLTNLSRRDAERELSASQRELEDCTGGPVRTCAYPFGRANAMVRRLAADQFDLACGTRLGFVGPTADRFELPRLDAYYLRRAFWFRRLDAPSGAAYIRLRRFLRDCSASLG